MANTTADKLQAALNSKEEIRLAIQSKGVECGIGVPLAEYPSKVRSIRHVLEFEIVGYVAPFRLVGTVEEENRE